MKPNKKLKKALYLLSQIQDTFYYGKDLKDKDVRRFYKEVKKEFMKEVRKLIE